MFSYPDHYKNLSTLREKILCDINLKRHLDSIKNRKISVSKDLTGSRNSDYKNEVSITNTNTIETDNSKKDTSRLPRLYNRNNITFASNSSRNSNEYFFNHSLINKRSQNLNFNHIKNENSKFKIRLKRASSPLKINHFEESYEKLKKYAEFSRKVKNLNQTDHNKMKILDNLRSLLPPLVINKFTNMKKK